MKVGMMLPAVQSVALNVAVAAGAAQVGVDTLWVPDHLLGFWHPGLWSEFPGAAVSPDPDAFLDPFCLAAVVGSSTELPLGTCVTDTTRRRAIDLVRTALTLHDSCPGGFILGVGAGETESTVPFGYDFSRPVSRLEQTLIEMRALLGTGQMPDGGPGRTGLSRSGPKGTPEIWVGAQGGPRSLGLAGRYGDGWLSLTYDVARFTEMLAVVRAAAEEAGRPAPTVGAFPVSFLGESAERICTIVDTELPLVKLLLLFADDDLWQKHGLTHPDGPGARGYHTIPHNLDAGDLRDVARQIPIEMFTEFVMLGNADEVAARIQPLADAGLQHVVLADMSALACGPDDAQEAVVQLAALTGHLRAM
jgi:phthiodiolone/phenolphthiodiolone dimycocerosates ketoreductase